MPQVPLQPGEMGDVTISTQTKKNGSVVYVGVARGRRLDGKAIRASGRGDSPTAARRATAQRFEVKKSETSTHSAPRTARADGNSDALSPDSSFTDLCRAWLADAEDEGRVRPQTLALYRGVLAIHIAPHLGNLRVREINAQRITVFLRERSRSESPSAADSAYKVIRAAWRFAQRSGITERDVLGGVVRPARGSKADRGEASRVVTPREAKYFLDLCSMYSPALGLAMRIAAETGARMGEIMALHEAALHPGPDPWVELRGTVVQRKGGAVRQPHGKTETSSRDVSVSELVMDQLLLAVAETKCTWGGAPPHTDGLVPAFPSTRGGWTSVQTMNAWRRAALEDSGVEWVSARVLRRTLATFIAAGQGDQVAADQLGHARVSVTARHYIDTHGVVRDAGPSAFAAFIDSDTDTAE